jgi:hypothetical protein
VLTGNLAPRGCVIEAGRRRQAVVATDRRRADQYRRRAIELAQEARDEADKGRRRFLLDKARSSMAAADAIAPELPSEPEFFRKM